MPEKPLDTSLVNDDELFSTPKITTSLASSLPNCHVLFP